MRRLYVPVREHRHRLDRRRYRGEVVASFHVCVAGRKPVFVDERSVAVPRQMLAEAARLKTCRVVAYCFMPDHVHVPIRGIDERADTWAAMVEWKRRSGRWLIGNAGARWQKDFYDEVLTEPGSVDGTIAYMLLNPVRQKMVEDWWDYPFSGRGL